MRPKSIGNKVYLISASLRPLLALIYGRAVIYNPKILSSEIQKDGCDLKNNFITLGIPNQQTQVLTACQYGVEWDKGSQRNSSHAQRTVSAFQDGIIIKHRTRKQEDWILNQKTPLKWCLPASSTVTTPRFKQTSRETSNDLQWATASRIDGWMDG